MIANPENSLNIPEPQALYQVEQQKYPLLLLVMPFSSYFLYDEALPNIITYHRAKDLQL